MNYSPMPSNRRSLKLELIDGSIQEIEYELPIDRYDLMRMIYHDLKYDRIYDWDTFYQSTTFIRTDNGIATLSPLNNLSNDTVYTLVLPNNNKSRSNVCLYNFFYINLIKVHLQNSNDGYGLLKKLFNIVFLKIYLFSSHISKLN
jgi:hypothetical protein